MSRTVVVGAGMGGLTAAIDLAAAGHHVDVFEALPTPGGKANIATVEGVTFDTGPSVMTLPTVFDDLLRRAGTSLADEVTLTLPEPASRYLYVDGTQVDVFSDRQRTVADVRRALGDEAAADVAGFLAYSQRIWEAAAPHFVLGDAPTLPHVLAMGPSAWAAVLKIDALRTMRSGIARRVRSEHLRWLMERYATYNGSDPSRAPATLNCIAHVELGLGVHGVEGGIHALVEALVRVATRLGVTLHLGQAVSGLLREGRRVTGVFFPDGRAVAADAVVVNADVAHLVADLLPAPAPRIGGRTTPSMSGWVGVLKARRRSASQRVGHTVLFPDVYDAEFRDIFDRDRPPADPTVYLCAQEKCHRRTGWAEHEPLFVMANTPPEPATGASDPQLWHDLRGVVLRRLTTHGLIDPDDTVVWERSPSGLAATFPGTRGALYGAASNDLFAAFRRPPNRIGALPGLYLASGSAHPGGGLPLCALSGVAAARAVARDLA